MAGKKEGKNVRKRASKKKKWKWTLLDAFRVMSSVLLQRAFTILPLSNLPSLRSLSQPISSVTLGMRNVRDNH